MKQESSFYNGKHIFTRSPVLDENTFILGDYQNCSTLCAKLSSKTECLVGKQTVLRTGKKSRQDN